MKSMPFWTICLDLGVSELLENLMWKEPGLVREEDAVLSGVLKMVLGMEGLTRPHLRCPPPRTCRGALPPAQPLLGFKLREQEQSAVCSLPLAATVAVPFLPGLLLPLPPAAHPPPTSSRAQSHAVLLPLPVLARSL